MPTKKDEGENFVQPMLNGVDKPRQTRTERRCETRSLSTAFLPPPSRSSCAARERRRERAARTVHRARLELHSRLRGDVAGVPMRGHLDEGSAESKQGSSALSAGSFSQKKGIRSAGMVTVPVVPTPSLL